MARSLTPKDALLLVDIQLDFCPAGALPVPGGDAVVAAANRWIDQARAGGALIVATRDQHPLQHPSFQQFGGPWPAHCVAGTAGAEFHPLLRLPPEAVRLVKGTRLDQDQYSAFDQTGLADFLRKQAIERIWVAGLAEDVCVKATALDAVAEGFEVHVLAEASRALSPEGSAKARAEMMKAGVLMEGLT